MSYRCTGISDTGDSWVIDRALTLHGLTCRVSLAVELNGFHLDRRAAGRLVAAAQIQRHGEPDRCDRNASQKPALTRLMNKLHHNTLGRNSVSDLRAVADRVEIEALRGEFADAVMMRDGDRLASLFAPDGALRMPNVPGEFVGREEIRAGRQRLVALWDYFVQTTHPGTIHLDGDTASGRAYIQELARTLDGRSGLNYAIYHDRYQRTPDGWKFTERVYEVKYQDTTPLAGSAPNSAATAADPRAGNKASGQQPVSAPEPKPEQESLR
jgi:ketosteroid isomerase-like protein